MMSELEDRVRQTLREYREARERAANVRSQYIHSGSIGPRGEIGQPPKLADDQGIRDMLEAEESEREKREAHQATVNDWLASRRSN